MITRCPECATRFRVHGEQLEVADGRVRCGRCGCLFDVHIYASQAVGAPGSAGPEVLVAERPPRPEPELVADAAEAITVPVTPGPAPTHPGSGRWKSWLAGGFALLLLLALGVQGIWWQRHTLAARPQGLELVRLLCRIAPCQPRPPKALEQIEILERGLKPHPERPEALRFHLRMVNRAALAQPYPLLELRLLDGLQRPAGVRRFTPADYLVEQGDGLLDPGTPTDVGLELISPGEHVNGFQLDFF